LSQQDFLLAVESVFSVAADGSTVTISSTNPTVEPGNITGLTEYIQDIIGLSGITAGSGNWY